MVSQPERRVSATASRSSGVRRRSKTGIRRSGDVSVAPIERVSESILLQRIEHLGDPVRHDHPRLEAQRGADLVEADLVVARVLVAANVLDLAPLGLLADLLHQIELAVVLTAAAHVE